MMLEADTPSLPKKALASVRWAEPVDSPLAAPPTPLVSGSKAATSPLLDDGSLELEPAVTGEHARGQQWGCCCTLPPAAGPFCAGGLPQRSGPSPQGLIPARASDARLCLARAVCPCRRARL